ncbi:MAG: VPS10 domain-containing protein, partial [Gemmataceae bacterium]
DTATYYVAVACGGVWKTTNNGTTWAPIFDEQGSYSIGCITLDPKNPNTIWVGTGENNSQRSVGFGDGVYKSTDGGKTWANLGLKFSEHIGKIAIDPRDSETVYVAAQGPLWGPGGDRGLYKTTDGGKSWSKVLAIDENTGVTDFVIDSKNPDTITAASYQRRRHVWTLINGGPGSGIHRTTDGGKTWKKVTTGLPTGDLGRIGLEGAPSDSNIVYAIIESTEGKGGIFRSDDGGKGFAKMNPFDSQAQYYAHIVVDPVNANRIYVMNVYLLVSDDGGRNVRALGEGNKHVDNHDIWIDPKNPSYYRVGCDGGIYESHDRGAHWHFKSNLPVTQFYDIGVDQNPKSGPFYNVYGGTQDNFTLGGPVRTRSEHGIMNSDWFVVQGGDGFHCKVDPTDSNIVYGEYQHGGLCRFDRRTGNRVDIQPLAKPGEPPLRWNWDSAFMISPHNPKRLYFAANKLFRSDDRGDSWTAISPDLTRQRNRDLLPVMGKIWGPDAVSKHVSTSFYGNIVALAESLTQEGLIYVGTDDGLIQVTTDGGKTWNKMEKIPTLPEGGVYVSKIVASQHSAKTLYAAFDNHKNADFKPYLLKSTDAGTSWTSIVGDLPERGSVYVIAEDHKNPNLLFCGTEFGLYVTFDGGTKWHRMKNGLPTIQVKDLVIQKQNDDLVVGTFGRGFYVLDHYGPLRELTVENLEKPAFLATPHDAMAYVTNAQFGGAGKAFLGASHYTADNPPFGTALVYHLKSGTKTLREKRREAEKEAEKKKEPIRYPSLEELRAEAEEEAAAVQILISDAEGKLVRTLFAPAGEGVHTVTWDLRDSGLTAIGGEDNTGGGFLVIPGTYSAELVRREGQKYVAVAKPVKFQVLPDPLSGLTPADYAEVAAFHRKVKAIRKTMAATMASATELTTKLDQLKRGFELAEKPDLEAKTTVRQLIEKHRAQLRRLRGDNILAGRNENTPTALNQRISSLSFASDGAIIKPLAGQLQEYAVASKLLAEEIAELRTRMEKEAAALEKKLEAAGGPLPTGKLPSWDGK